MEVIEYGTQVCEGCGTESWRRRGLGWELGNGKARIDPLTIAFFLSFQLSAFQTWISSFERLLAFACLLVQYFSLLLFSLSCFLFLIRLLLVVCIYGDPGLHPKPAGKSLQCTTILLFFGVFDLLFHLLLLFALTGGGGFTSFPFFSLRRVHIIQYFILLGERARGEGVPI